MRHLEGFSVLPVSLDQLEATHLAVSSCSLHANNCPREPKHTGFIGRRCSPHTTHETPSNWSGVNPFSVIMP